MSLTIIIPAAAEPITLAEARLQCRVDGTDEDTLLGVYIAAARAACEGLLQRPLITRTVEQAFDAFPASSGPVVLEGTPAQAVVSVKYTDTAGAEITLSSGQYTLDTSVALAPTLRLIYGATWPSTRDTPSAVRVRYTVGFGTAPADMPADVRVWLLMTVALMFTNRELVDAAGKAAALPGRFVDTLLDPWRVYGA